VAAAHLSTILQPSGCATTATRTSRHRAIAASVACGLSRILHSLCRRGQVGLTHALRCASGADESSDGMLSDFLIPGTLLLLASQSSEITSHSLVQ
jgi:hypothetical protein